MRYMQKIRSIKICSQHLLKSSKRKCYDKFVNNNLNDLKDTWKGIRNLISMNKSATSVPASLSQNEESTTDPVKIGNIIIYGWGSTVSRLQSHYKETVYFLLLSPQEVLVLIGLTLEG